jgi:hypothetical protein
MTPLEELREAAKHFTGEDLDRIAPVVRGKCANCGNEDTCREVKGPFPTIGDRLCPSCFSSIWNAFLSSLAGDAAGIEKYANEFNGRAGGFVSRLVH